MGLPNAPESFDHADPFEEKRREEKKKKKKGKEENEGHRPRNWKKPPNDI